MSSPPIIIIRLDDGADAYQPGQTLSGEYWIDGLEPEQIRAVELSVLWYTSGKGDEDMAVHEFQRQEADDLRLLNLAVPQRFSTILPNSPLSYEGQIVKVRWCVRVRVFPYRGRELLGEKPFRLGNIAPARPHSGR